MIRLFERLAEHPIRLASALFCVVALALVAWSIARSPSKLEPTLHLYGEQFVLRGPGNVAPYSTVLSPRAGQSSAAVYERQTFQAGDYSVVVLKTEQRDSAHAIELVWRLRDDPNRVQSLNLGGSALPQERILMNRHPGWRGEIVGIGLRMQHPNGQPLRLMSLEVMPLTWSGRLGWSPESSQIALGPARNDAQAAWSVVAVRLAPFQWLVLGVTLVLLALWATLGLRLGGKAALAGAATTAVTALVLADLADVHARSANLTMVPANVEVVSQARELIKAEPASRVWVFTSSRDNIPVANVLAPAAVLVTLPDQTLPSSEAMQGGDLILVLNRRNVRFSPQSAELRWPTSQGGRATEASVRAELFRTAQGDGLFRVVTPRSADSRPRP